MEKMSIEYDLVPSHQDCAYLSSEPEKYENYKKDARLEYQAITEQLLRINPEYARLKFRYLRCPHDFGTYFNLEIIAEREEDIELLFGLEEAWPREWDKPAREYLTQNGYSVSLRPQG